MPAEYDRPRTFISLIVMSLVAVAPVVLLPLLVGSFVEYMGLTSAQAGQIAAAEMAGAACATVLLPLVISRVPRRHLMAVAMVVFIIANLASILAGDALSLALARFIAGIGAGWIIGGATACFAATRNPDRSFSIFMFSNLALGAIGFPLLPSLVLEPFGLAGLFILLALGGLLSLTLIRNIPESVAKATEAQRGMSFLRPVSVIALLGVLAYFIGMGAVWPFIERIGSDRALSTTTVYTALTLAQFAGMGGALLAVWIAARFSRVQALGLGSSLTIGAMIMLVTTTGQVSYMVATVLFFFAWIYTIPVLMGGLAELDRSGRVAVLGVTMQTAGLSAGPYIASFVSVQGNHAVVANIGWSLHIVGFALWTVVLLSSSLRATLADR